MESFQDAFEAEVLKIDANFDHMKKNPENHPKYKEEWERFWYNKFRDLQKQGKDSINYDFKPEWKIFWNQRIKELRNKEVAEMKEILRTKFKLCESNSDSGDDKTSEPLFKRYRKNSFKDKVDKKHRFECYDGSVNLVTVCRLLTALESELGLLAESTVELLSKSVALEKSKPNSSIDLLDVSKNMNLLDTVKEKLKGILSANIIESNKVEVVKQSIQNIAILMHEHSQRAVEKKHLSSESSENEASLNDSTHNGAVDPVTRLKGEIAIAITENLMNSGRCDISAKELESLVEEFFSDVDEEEKLIENEASEVVGKDKNNIELLSDEELEILFRNFSDLNAAEQSKLNDFLNNLEKYEPEKVQRLKKFIDLG